MKIRGFFVFSLLASIINSSNSFSPGFNPVKIISISPSKLSASLTFKPLNLIICFANSRILTGSPISNKKTSPPLERFADSKTNSTASGIVMKYLTTASSVTVTGPPFSICFLKRGTTDPDEPKTFPNLTIENFLLFSLFFLTAFA